MHNVNNTQAPTFLYKATSPSSTEYSELKSKISDIHSSQTSLKTPASVSEKENFATSFNQKCLDFLFSSSGKEDVLRSIYSNSMNAYAKSEILEFSNVLYSLVHQNGLNFENEKGLQKIVAQYSELIIKDKLSQDSAFGPWSAKNKKLHQLRQNIEHRLALLAQQHTSGEALSLGQKLLNTEVSSFIKNNILAELKLSNETVSSLKLDDLVDAQAKLAFDSLRNQRKNTIDSKGFGIGKLSRDLNTVAVFPELLRKVLNDILEDIKDSHPIQDGLPTPPEDMPDGGPTPGANEKTSQPVIHYHINNDNRTYDNRVFDNRVYDNSYHENPENDAQSPTSQTNDLLSRNGNSLLNPQRALVQKVTSVLPHSISDTVQTFANNSALEKVFNHTPDNSDGIGSDLLTTSSQERSANNSLSRGHRPLNIQNSSTTPPLHPEGVTSSNDNSSDTTKSSASLSHRVASQINKFNSNTDSKVLQTDFLSRNGDTYLTRETIFEASKKVTNSLSNLISLIGTKSGTQERELQEKSKDITKSTTEHRINNKLKVTDANIRNYVTETNADTIDKNHAIYEKAKEVSSALSKVLSKIDDTSAELLTDDISDLKNNNDITAENNNI
ncbi:T3SS effector invasin IpaA, partial [Shigella flexneri]|nr:T3SS effector invasin IpaA [Shigella flexneri]EIU6170758.1 T3SS effector invasin IpaA [Shigella flexneri]EKK0076239.1 T3SS effector invasin IpaA [Shigella flexneri]